MTIAGRAHTGPRIIVLHHYGYPDDVVSAKIFDELCEELSGDGWSVEAWPCNRSCRDEDREYPAEGRIKNVRIRRVWRPPLAQSKLFGRLISAVLVIATWTFRLITESPTPAAVVISSEPLLSVLLTIPVCMLRGIAVIHWCFDVYPEAATTDGAVPEWLVRLCGVRRLLSLAYSLCDAVVDIGPCMRRRLDSYHHTASVATIPPWALAEPPRPLAPVPDLKADLFGKPNVLGLLYSGTFGKAHTYADFLSLAKELEFDDVRVCFSVRGHRTEDLLDALRKASLENIVVKPFASDAELENHLAAADIHLVSLRNSWEGLVVPSKFFGSLAAGRPVIFAGPEQSGIAQWIRQYGVGWVLSPASLASVAHDLRCLRRDPIRLRRLQEHCHSIYHAHFSRSAATVRWKAILGSLKRSAETDHLADRGHSSAAPGIGAVKQSGAVGSNGGSNTAG